PPGATAPAATRAAALPRAAGAYVATRRIPATQATQAAAADARFVYAVSSTTVAKHDRATGTELARSTGPAQHLNSAFVWDGKVYCAHSNYPHVPETSEIRVLDPESMRLTVFHAFERPPGSLTWAVQKGDAWWCFFAHYGKDNAASVLVRYDGEWKETGRWTCPPELVAEWGQYSLSGGVWVGDDLLVTGHDKRVVYRVRVPKEGTVLEAVEAIGSPFPGQGIAVDPAEADTLVGISRGSAEVVFARYERKQ
ncbi:MAG TPA: hypothetical protein VF796_19010, partial [Humisphaera sp.]